MGLLFYSSNPTMIYSNYPEEIAGNSMGDHYIIEADIQANTVYTLFYYHWNFSSLQKRIGVAIKNTGLTALTVTYSGGGVLAGTSALANCATLSNYCVNGSSGTSLRAVSNLARGASAFLAYNDTATQTCAVGKIMFKTNTGATVRIFHAPATITAAGVFNLTQDSESSASGDESRLCGAGIQCAKDTRINCDVTSSFTLFEFKGKSPYSTYENDDEYQHRDTFAVKLNHGAEYLWGNYEMIYTLNLSNAAGKTLYLKPSEYPAQILTYTSTSGKWTKQPYLSNGYYTIPLGNSSTAKVKIILVGGNYGNMACNFTGSFK